MLAYIIRRLLLMIPTLFGIMVINFLIIQAAPGGPVEQMILKIKGTGVSATERVSGEGSELLSARSQSTQSASQSGSRVYRGSQAWTRNSSSAWSTSTASTSRCPSAST
jgi:microcin C transport system permease protein